MSIEGLLTADGFGSGFLDEDGMVSDSVVFHDPENLMIAAEDELDFDFEAAHEELYL